MACQVLDLDATILLAAQGNNILELRIFNFNFYETP